MANATPEWLSWTVNLLQVAQDDHILEIGCGRGFLISMLCARLTSGKIKAIDRSAKMVDAASARNSACVAAGKAEILPVDLHLADFGSTKFNKIVAVNVNVFWMKPMKELAVVRKALSENGALYLVYQPPESHKCEAIVVSLEHNLRQTGFCQQRTVVETLPSGITVCAVQAYVAGQQI
ncbi:MAG: class I SAM-dependent methyltransferase [Anaerolineae bacterium]|nr:class I SAM-dependent methyltransferase [Anaerolineae bacterium]